MKETNLAGHDLTSYERTERQRRTSQLGMLIDTGIDPYPTHFPQRTHSIQEIVNSPDSLIDTEVVIAGRIIGQRNHKNATFLDVRDFSGEMQAMADKSRLEAIQFNLARTAFSSGDIAAITGIVTRTHRGSTAVDATDLTMLSKSLLPLPTQLQGAENRHAKRHLDLLANEESREILIARNRITRQIRSILEERDLIEVESPIVNTFYNGGVAKPFITHHNALSEPAYLRMTSELYLKRIITSGIEGVYEMSKQFRNEGMGGIYSPEFTVLEAYKAYEDHEWMMDLIQDIIQKSALSVNDSLETTWQGNQIDLSGDWPRMSMRSAVGISLGLGSEPSSDDIYRSADGLGVEGEYGEVLGNLFRRVTEPTLIQPTFITDFPTSLSPLAKSDPNHADHVLKFMLYIGGTLISDGNYEENDPLKQRANLAEQERVQIQQGIDQYPRDADFLDALEHGMPPVSGSAIGIDRLTMLITGNDNIREVMAFRPKKTKKY